MSQFLPDVRTYAGVPPVGAFASILGTPIVIDNTTNTPYYLAPGDVVTAIGGGGGGGGVIVTTPSGTPSGTATTISFPNGTIAIVAGVATYTPGASSSKYIRGAGWAGGGIALTVPANDVAITCQATGVIQSVTVLGIGGSGSCVIDIWKSTYAAALPTVANSIVAAAFPTISSGVKSQDTTLTGWTKSITAGDVLVFHLVSVSNFIALQIILEIA